jgi:dolichol-phosphate mannosyltransferase
VRKVVLEWFAEIENWTEDFVFLALDDGSTDDTPRLLAQLREQLGPRFEWRSHANRGHGQTCIAGYRDACERGARFVFQIDSDGQCDPQFFFRLWRLRDRCDVVYGSRVRRDDGWRRVAASMMLKLVLGLFARVRCVDANTPYRLMRCEVLRPVLPRVPREFFLANVALAVLLRREAGVREGSVPVHFRERYGGEPVVALSNFGGRAFELIRQIRSLP